MLHISRFSSFFIEKNRFGRSPAYSANGIPNKFKENSSMTVSVPGTVQDGRGDLTFVFKFAVPGLCDAPFRIGEDYDPQEILNFSRHKKHC